MNKLLTTAILSISMITVMASAAVSPALGSIAKAFPEAGFTLIKTILTLPALFIIPFSLLSSVLVRKYGNKRVLSVGIIIYIIGGIGPVFVNSVYELLFFRAVLGAGCGLIMPISQALIAFNYEGKLKARITAYSGAASYFMGVIASFVVAPLSAFNWHYSFYIYTVAIAVLVLNIIALPDERPVKKHAAAQHMFAKRVWGFIGIMFLINAAFYAVPTNVALFMREASIGAAHSAGVVISAFMIAGFAAGVTLPRLQQAVKKHTVLLGVLVMALGYICLSLSYSLLPVIAGSALVGFSFGVLFPSVLGMINTSATGSSLMLALSLSSCAQFLGQFLSPYMLSGVKAAFGMSYLRHDFIILAFALSISVVLMLAYGKREKLYRIFRSYSEKRTIALDLSSGK
ncbi:Cyanate permease [Parelusimicrobium proximum]|uniref:MFS transporter n=1 Tax=Parelusimicrobium proximum TaxID=3228953 RepID=UPI003D177E00